MSDLALRLQNVGKRFARRNEEFWALRDVSFDVARGETLGLIGRNGAGKSTLFKLLARITDPTEGYIGIKGRLAGLLDVGTGFNQELTGRENIYLNGAMFGMRRREIDRKLDEIIAFSEIERFIGTPVKKYSSGMRVRLAFSVAAHVAPDILLIDEVLAVGDMAFRKKCIAKMSSMIADGCTMLLVSHDADQFRQLCSRCIWLRGGRVEMIGPTDAVIAQYSEATLPSTQVSLSDMDARPGSGAIRITGYRSEIDGRKTNVLVTGKDACFVFDYQTPAAGRVDRLRLSIQVRDVGGANVLWLHNEMMGHDFGPITGKGELRCLIPRLPLTAGTYTLRVQLLLQNGSVSADDLTLPSALHIIDGDFYGAGFIRADENPAYLVDARWLALQAHDAPEAQAPYRDEDHLASGAVSRSE